MTDFLVAFLMLICLAALAFGLLVAGLIVLGRIGRAVWWVMRQ